MLINRQQRLIEVLGLHAYLAARQEGCYVLSSISLQEPVMDPILQASQELCQLAILGPVVKLGLELGLNHNMCHLSTGTAFMPRLDQAISQAFGIREDATLV